MLRAYNSFIVFVVGALLAYVFTKFIMVWFEKKCESFICDPKDATFNERLYWSVYILSFLVFAFLVPMKFGKSLGIN